MKKTIFLLMFTLGLTTTMLISCYNDNIPDKKKPDWKNQTGNDVYVFDSETIDAKLQSISESGTLTFNKLQSDRIPKKNDIICSAPSVNAPQGFLYRVESISKIGEQIVIQTKEVSLEEVIKKANVSETIDLEDHIVGVFDEDGNPLEYTVLKSDQVPTASVDNKTKININVTFNGVGIKGSLIISNKLEFELNIDDWELNYMKFAYTKEVEMKVLVTGELKGKLTYVDLEIATIKLEPILILIPTPFGVPVPLVITPEIPIHLKGELNGAFKGDFTLFDNKSTTSVGVKYENNEVKGIFEEKNTDIGGSLAERLNVSVSGENKITAGPGILLSLYNSRSVSVEAKVGIFGKYSLVVSDGNVAQILDDYIRNNLIYALNPRLTLSTGVEAGVNAKLNIFALKLLDYKASMKIFETELRRYSVFPQFTDISFSNMTNNSATVTTTVNTPADYNFIFPVSQHGICLSQISLPTIDNSIWYNKLGVLPIVWTTIPEVSANLTNLHSNQTYYVCPYFTNWFGTFYGKVENFITKDDGDDDNKGEWVLINGVKWATRNVGVPHTFVQNPEDYGGYYQWNKGTTDYLMGNDYYKSVYANTSSWLMENDPSPSGYRIPTLTEIQRLTNINYVTILWTKQNGVSGCIFIDNASGKSIFLPFAGNRIDVGGAYFSGSSGYYWSSTFYNKNDYNSNAYSLRLSSDYSFWTPPEHCDFGLSIRSVVK